MIRLSNGHEFTFACGSGALAFDGRGWWWEHPLRWLGILNPKAFTVVAKTVTWEPKKGNLSLLTPWTCVRPVSSADGKKIGATNAVGLTNPGIQAWVNDYYPTAKRKGYDIAASVKPDTVQQAKWMAEWLHNLDLKYIEVNLSCPNVHKVSDDIPEMLRMLTLSLHPVVLKLSLDQVNGDFIRQVDKFVDGYHGINTVEWKTIFPDKKSPIEHYPHSLKGGVSGQFITDLAVEAVAKLRMMTEKPIIGGGGIFDLDDVLRFEEAGASAFSIGTCFMLKPWRPNRIVKQYNKLPTFHKDKYPVLDESKN